MKVRRLTAVSLALMLVLSCGARAEEPGEETPQQDPNVVWCMELGVIRPGPDEPFASDALLSKIQFITMVSRALGLYDDAEIPYFLAKQDHFDAGAANALFNSAAYPVQDWAKPLSRFEAASICYQSMVMSSGYLWDGSLPYANSAADRAAIPADYLPVVNGVYAMGVMNGVDELRTFRGWDSLTQAQGCALVRRILDPEARAAPRLPTDFDALYGSCTTRYGGGISGYASPYRENRIFNILRAGETLNELVIQPGETFSYNAIIGNAGKAQGYLLASVLSEGEYKYGYGGGICQVSSMLFNAALSSNMTILERYNHGRRSAYLPAGTDSTVYYGSLDLKWRNDYGCPVKLVFTHDEKAQTVTISIYGSVELYRPQVSLDVVQSKKDPDLYTLKRTADGVVNYTSSSRYKK